MNYFSWYTKITTSNDFYAILSYDDNKPERVTGMKAKKGTFCTFIFPIVVDTTGTIHFSVHLRFVTKTQKKNMAHLIDKVLGEPSTWLKN